MKRMCNCNDENQYKSSNHGGFIREMARMMNMVNGISHFNKENTVNTACTKRHSMEKLKRTFSAIGRYKEVEGYIDTNILWG